MSREYFDQIASTWDERVRHDSHKIQRLLDAVGLPADGRILDVGCGTGVLVPHILQRLSVKGSLCAVDYSPNMIAQAQKKYQAHSLTFRCADILGGEFATQAYDAVLCYSVFPHFPDAARAIEALVRCLAPGGKLAVMHSQGREAINAMHKQAEDTRAQGYLPDIQSMQRHLRAARLEYVLGLDDVDLYLVVGRVKG